MDKKDTVSGFNRLLSKFVKFKGVRVAGFKDITNIPFTTRDELSDWRLSMCPNKPVELYFTSGTTRGSFALYYSKESLQAIDERLFKAGILSGIKKGDAVLNLLQCGFVNSGIFVHRMINRIGASAVSTGGIRDNNIKPVLHLMETLKPSVIIGTHSSIYDLLSATKKKCKFIRLILSTGSVLTDRFRKNMEKKSGGRLYNVYGCNEVSIMAIQDAPKEKKWMRLIDDGLYVEVLKDNGEARECGIGRVLVTDFNNFSFPVIRYIVGDYVEIIKRGGIKYIRIFGREDKHTNINYKVTSVNLLTDTVMQSLGHNRFNILVENNPDSLRDKVTVLILKKDGHLKQAIRDSLKNNTGISVSVAVSGKGLFKNASEKYVNFLDRRAHRLKYKELYW
ncbi:MAG: AMP-binding protein [Candidatus Omnitrophica bacterium]|nr:AMP-binding protein [Candidatus Omnitrophota bacterium]